MRTARIAADEVLAEVSDSHRVQAKTVIDALIAWSERHKPLVQFDETVLQHPRLGFNGIDGQVIWLCRRLFSGEAMIEIMTRTGKRLPAEVLAHLKRLLSGVIPADALIGNKVMQVSTSELNSQKLIQLISALDFSLGAVTGLGAMRPVDQG